LLEDSEGICQRLDQAMDATIQAYVDPWQEANEPATPTQFAPTLDIIGKVLVAQA